VSRTGTLDQKRLDYLKMVAPNITVLKLSKRQRVDALDISGWNLKKLELMVHSMKFNENDYSCIKSPYVNQVVRYNLVDKRIVQGGQDADEKSHMVDIVSMNDQHFLFYGYSISIMQKKNSN
jgi:hypothetical protein